MKIKIMSIFNILNEKGVSIVDLLTNKWESVVIPSGKKKRYFVELAILFSLERDSVHASK